VYLPKPSARARGIDDEPDVTWQDVYDHIPKNIYGRCLRLHVVLGGYSLYEKPSEDGEGVSGKRFKTVHVHEETIRVIHPQRELSCALSKQISTIAYQNSHAEATSLWHAEKSEKTASAITWHCRLSSVLCPTNYHVGRSGAHSNQAAASTAHECVTVGHAVFC
jgi:hypothetical protein